MSHYYLREYISRIFDIYLFISDPVLLMCDWRNELSIEL